MPTAGAAPGVAGPLPHRAARQARQPDPGQGESRMKRPSLRRGLTAATSVTAIAFAGVLFAPSAVADVTNGGFETGTLSGWTTAGTTAVVNSGAHSGSYAAR